MNNKKAKLMLETLERTQMIASGKSVEWFNFDSKLPWVDNFHDHSPRERQKSARVLLKVKKLLSADAFADLESIIDDSESVGGYKITAHRKGDEQETDLPHIKTIFVHCDCMGGISGDEYYGDIYVPISKKRFFLFTWST